jgi:Rho-binding antiterminator
MTRESTGYQPISCELHDVLEDVATRGVLVSVRYRDESGANQQRKAVIVNVFALRGSEFLVLDSGETVRLDRLDEVDGTPFRSDPGECDSGEREI